MSDLLYLRKRILPVIKATGHPITQKEIDNKIMGDISDEMLSKYGAHPEDEPTHVSNFAREFLAGLESTPLKEPNDCKQWWKKDMTFLKKNLTSGTK